MANTQISKNNIDKEVGKSYADTLLVGMKLVQGCWKTVLKFLKKSEKKNEDLAYDPAIPILEIYLNKIKSA